MTDKETLAELTTAEFDQLIENFIDRDDDRIEPTTFLMALAELEQRRAVREVELTGSIVNGQFVFDTPAPLPVSANSVTVGDLKMILHMRQSPNDLPQPNEISAAA